MKVIYVCDFCEEIVEETELEDEMARIDQDSLTGEEWHDIIKTNEGNIYFKTLCDECTEELSLDQDFTFIKPNIN